MKIAILGAGAMGSLFGGYLSRHNEVWLVDIDKNKVDHINNSGVRIEEENGEITVRLNAVTNTSNLPEMDLLVVFVKALYSEKAIYENKNLIGKDTYLMTLQNGAGHEAVLGKFVSSEKIIIGSTQHNSSLIGVGHIHHGGGGLTSIGLINGSDEALQAIAENFTKCGFETVVAENVRKQIWAKLMLNTAASSLTAVLQVRLGFILENEYAWKLAQCLAKEAVEVANASGIEFDYDETIESIGNVLSGAKDGYTSIYADLKNSARTEVDTISGSVVNEGRRLNVPVPNHEFIVNLIHAMEDKNQGNKAEEFQ